MKLSEIKALTKDITLTNTPKSQKEFYDYLKIMGYNPGDFYQELEMESRFVDTHQDSSFSNSQVSLHSHTFYEILYLHNSCGAEYLLGTERYRLQRGDIILIPPGLSHRPLLPANMAEPYLRDVLWLSSDFLKLLQERFPDYNIWQSPDIHLLRTAGTAWEFLGDKFHQGVLESETKEVGWEIAVVSNTMQLMVQLHRAMQNRTARVTQAEQPELLDRVIAYIEEHLSERITLSDVAKHFYISESTISQIFRKKMDSSFHRCVTQRRLIAAKNLILNGVVLEIAAQQAGFSDYSTFYRAFKNEFGISPRQFRNQYTLE